MVNKLVSKGIKFVARKTGNKVLEKVSNTYDYIRDRTLLGSKPLNIGEQETLRCYSKTNSNNKAQCKSVGNKVRYDYHHPWKSK